jgi:hypothetical protein
MSASALESQGIVLQIEAKGSPQDYATIPNTKDVSFRTGSASVIDVTDLQSSAKEKRMGLQDEGQCTFTLQFVPTNAQHAELVLAKGDRLSRAFKVIMTDSPNTIYWFRGFVLSVPITAGVDGVIESAVVVEITGLVTSS